MMSWGHLGVWGVTRRDPGPGVGMFRLKNEVSVNMSKAHARVMGCV